MGQDTEKIRSLYKHLHEVTLAKRQTGAMKRFDNDLKLEMLLLISLHENDEEWGIADYINCISASPQSNSSMHGFIRDLLEDDILVATETSKKSRKHLMMSERLRKEVNAYFKVLANVFKAQEDGVVDRQHNRGPELDDEEESFKKKMIELPKPFA